MVGLERGKIFISKAYYCKNTNAIQDLQVGVPMVGLNYSSKPRVTIADSIPGTVLLLDTSQTHPLSFGTQANDTVGAQQYTANRLVNLSKF